MITLRNVPYRSNVNSNLISPFTLQIKKKTEKMKI